MDNLAFIRDTMEAAGSFTAVSGWGMVAVGMIATVAASIAAAQQSVLQSLYVWMAAAVLAPVVMLWAIVRKARRAHVPLLSGPGRKFVLSFSPPILVGALLTIVLYRAGLVQTIPGMWLLLYGTAVVAGGAFSVKVVPVMGFCFMLAGTLALFTPQSWNDWIMAAAFGGLHIGFGIPVAWRHGG
jgi:glucan phosphoethanolaminetransferase (alkaline phosphatase superfamily)